LTQYRQSSQIKTSESAAWVRPWLPRSA